MDWLSKLSGIAPDMLMNISIPKEKLVGNLKNSLFKVIVTGEFGNVQDIIYHAILRETCSSGYSEELHIIEVSLYEPKYVKAIAEAFQKTIPYPKVIIFSSGEKYLFFHDYGLKNEISQHQFSDWVYEEELMVDYALGVELQAESACADYNLELCSNLPYQLEDFFHCAESSEFICLRHLIDDLKILEINTGKNYVRPILFQLINEDRVEYLNDIPFVLWSDANQQYHRRTPEKSALTSSIVDHRFGIDRRFEPLTASDFTTTEEVMDLLSEAEGTLCYLEWDEDRYDDKKSDEYSEDYDDYD